MTDIKQNGKIPDPESRSWATVSGDESPDEEVNDDSGDWEDESGVDSALEEANYQFGYMSLSSPQDQPNINLNPEMESQNNLDNIKPLPRDASSIPNWLLTHIEPGAQTKAPETENTCPSDHSNESVKPLQRSDTVPRWMLPHIRRDETDKEAIVEPLQPPSTLKRKSISWDPSSLHDYPPRPAPTTHHYTLHNPSTPFHHRSTTSLLKPSSPFPDHEETVLLERLDQALLNRDRNYDAAEGKKEMRRIDGEIDRSMSEGVEIWENEVRQARESREKKGVPVVQWVKKEMRDKARSLWGKVKGGRR